MSVRSNARFMFTAAVMMLCTATAGRAQTMRAVTTDSGWIVVSSAPVDLWYHGFAILGGQGVGPLAIYDPDYVSGIRPFKQSEGIYPTAFDDQASQLADLLRSVNQTDLLHFVPLYLGGADVPYMLQTIADVAEGRATRGTADFQLVEEALRRSFDSRSGRRFARELVSGLTKEWEEFYEGHWLRMSEDRSSQITTIQAAWDRFFAPAFGAFLARRGLSSGTLVVSPALAFEGRIVQTDGTLLVAVGLLGAPQPPEVSALLLIKELCFVVLPRTEARLRGSREDLERIRRNLAVRCGEALFEQYMPSAASAYRQLFAIPFGGGSAAPDEFALLYRLDDRTLDAMRDELFER